MKMQEAWFGVLTWSELKGRKKTMKVEFTKYFRHFALLAVFFGLSGILLCATSQVWALTLADIRQEVVKGTTTTIANGVVGAGIMKYDNSADKAWHYVIFRYNGDAAVTNTSHPSIAYLAGITLPANTVGVAWECRSIKMFPALVTMPAIFKVTVQGDKERVDHAKKWLASIGVSSAGAITATPAKRGIYEGVYFLFPSGALAWATLTEAEVDSVDYRPFYRIWADIAIEYFNCALRGH